MRKINTEFVFFKYETANWTKRQPFTPWDNSPLYSI